MKKIFILALFCLLSYVDATAQWTGTSTLGNTGRFGNVGIGTTAPTERLDVRGDIILPDASGSTSGNLYFGGRTENGQNGMRLFGGDVNNGFSGRGGFIDVNAGNINDGLRIRVNTTNGGTERMRINAAGNVGIGTANPLARLDVRGTNIFLGGPSFGGGPVPTRFAAMGQSGGSIGTTCNLWGFTAQRSSGNSINMGVRNDNQPIINWANTSENLQIRIGTAGSNCGTLLASFGPNSFDGGPATVINGIGVTVGGMWQYVDADNERNTTKISDALTKLTSLEGITYEYNSTPMAEDRDRPAGVGYAFDVAKMQRVFPGLVKQDVNGLTAINYDAMIPVVTEAIKDQQEVIAEQNTLIDALNTKLEQQATQMEALMARLEALESNTAINTKETIELNDATAAIVLSKNRPNPFSNTTTFEYEIPEDIQNASLVVYDIYGKEMKRFALDNARGSIEFDGTNLSNGTYIYAILANGQKIAYQKMLVQK